MFNNEINNTQQTKLAIDLRSNQENETFFSRCLFVTSGIFILPQRWLDSKTMSFLVIDFWRRYNDIIPHTPQNLLAVSQMLQYNVADTSKRSKKNCKILTKW